MAGLLRYQIFTSYGILIIGLWYAAIQNRSSIIDSNETPNIPIFSSLPEKIQGALIDYFPMWILFCLAIYAIGSLVIGVANFSDCPDAAAEVERQAKEAKVEMKKRGIID
jgi:hypothetical protein